MTDNSRFSGKFFNKTEIHLNGSFNRDCFCQDRGLNETRTKWEKHLSRNMRCAALESRRFVRRNVFLRPIPRAGERNRERTTERGWESDLEPECSSRSKRAFSFRRFALGSGFVGFPAISWVSSSRGAVPREVSRLGTHRSCTQFYPRENFDA